MRMDKGKPFTHVRADSMDAPTFSERFLYETVGKGDARFILGVGDEYEHVIKALGPEALRALLDVKPVLVQRLGTGQKVVEWLEDARSIEDLRRSEEFPTQVILDDNAAESIWKILHAEYERYYEPEESMDSDHLRTYLFLTEALGSWEKAEKEKADLKKPHMIKRRDVEAEVVKRRRKAERAVRYLMEETEEPDPEVLAEAIAEWREAAQARPVVADGPGITHGDPYRSPEGCSCPHTATNTGWMLHAPGCKFAAEVGAGG